LFNCNDSFSTEPDSGDGRVEHTEHWLLTKALIDESEESIDVNILPLVNSFLYNKIK
jgi:hypothetical protein